MITSTTSTVQQTTYAQTNTTNKTKNSEFDTHLQNEESFKAEQARTEEIRFKKIERMSFEYIKNLDREKIDEIYGDLSNEEQTKISFLNQIANLSENDTLNKVLFDKAKNKTPKEVMNLAFQKASEQYHYKTTGTGQRFEVNTNMFTLGEDGKYFVNKNMKELSPDEYKLSHEEAFNMLLDMITSSKEGMKKAKDDELKKQYEEVLIDYTDILDRYNKELRRNLTGHS